MTRIHPFRALRYDPKRVELGRVLAPPYDVVSPEDRVRLYARDPHCAVRLVLRRDAAEETRTDYSDFAERLVRWRREGILVRDARPACYALRQRFRASDGRRLERLGFFAALHLEDYERRVVRPHERTLAAPKADRLKLLRATVTNLSSVFCLYEDRELGLERLLSEAVEGDALEAEDAEGVMHRLARIEAGPALERLQACLAERPVLIADGHHRYETALAYRDECLGRDPQAPPDAPFRSVLAYFANAHAPGTLLLPIHRVVKQGPVPDAETFRQALAGYAQQQVPVARPEDVPTLLERHLAPLADRHAFALDDASGVLRIFSRPADAELCVRVIHREVLQEILGLDEAAVRGGAVDFPKSALQAARDVRDARGLLAVYLNPLRPEDVFRVTGAGELLPPKSTFFHPKLPTGLVFRPLDDAG